MSDEPETIVITASTTAAPRSPYCVEYWNGTKRYFDHMPTRNEIGAPFLVKRIVHTVVIVEGECPITVGSAATKLPSGVR